MNRSRPLNRPRPLHRVFAVVVALLVLVGVPDGLAGQSIDQEENLRRENRVMLGVRFVGNSSRVSFIKPNGPAEQAGLQVGDEIHSVNERYILQDRDVVRALSSHKAGEVVKVEVRRGSEYRYFDLTVIKATRDGQRVAADGSILPPLPKFGMVGQKPEELTTTEWHGLAEGQSRLRLNDLQGKVVFLLIFQTTCEFTNKDALPLMSLWYGRYQDDPSIQFVAIQNSLPLLEQNTLQNAVTLFGKSGLTIPIGNDSGTDSNHTACKNFKAPGTPWIVLLDQKGVVQFNGLPADLDHQQDIIERLKAGETVASNRTRMDETGADGHGEPDPVD